MLNKYIDYLVNGSQIVKNKGKYKEKDRKVENSFTFKELLSKRDIDKLKKIDNVN